MLDQLEGFHSAQELYRVMKDRGTPVGLSTVYRTLQALADSRDVNAVWGNGHEMLYRRCGQDRHYHLVCRRCGRTHEVPDADLDRWASQLSARYRFIDVEPAIEVRGTCVDCSTSNE